MTIQKRDGIVYIESRLNEISDCLGQNVTHVEQVKRLSGGASQETWSFYAVQPQGRRKLILRRSPFGTTGTQGIGLAKEAAILRSLTHTDIPAPHVIHLFPDDDPIGSAYIMNAIEGETLPQRIFKDPRFEPGLKNFSRQCGAALARLHGTALERVPDLPLGGAQEQIAQYEAILRENEIERPVLEMALQWLKSNIPEGLLPVLVHGDFRMGNLMLDENGLAGILDWELCHLGDPREDIGWLCVNSWRFGRQDKRAGGAGDLAPLLEAYEEAGGQAFTEADIDFWECLGSFKWGIMCQMMYRSFKSGDDPSIERGSIGRRTSETEIDLIGILERL